MLSNFDGLTNAIGWSLQELFVRGDGQKADGCDDMTTSVIEMYTVWASPMWEHKRRGSSWCSDVALFIDVQPSKMFSEKGEI